jgi:ABC-2 type transport system ATP-binding protein
LILDEPAGGLDPAARREFLETSIHFLNEAGSAILFSSHHMTDVERLANRIVLVKQGKKVMDGELSEIQEQHHLLVMPLKEAEDSRLLENLSGVISRRKKGDRLHVVVEGTEACIHRELKAQGVPGLRLVALSLEELFIELAGGGR